MAAHRYPDTHVFYRKLARRYPLITHGEGCALYDSDGRRYLDAVGGAFVANLGHGVTEIAEAMARQAARLAYVNGTAFTHEAVEELATLVAELCPGDLDKVYPLGSGSEAVEAALKLARQYWVESGRPGKHAVIALAPAYHGNTLLALSASAREHYKTYFREWLVDVVRIPAPYSYRCDCRGTSPYCSACSGAALEEAILQRGPDAVAAFIAEPIGGSSTGASVPPAGYFQRVREICDRYDVLFIADEVMTGIGRTGRRFGIEHWNVVPDLMAVAKGISAGYMPLGAALCSARIYAAFHPPHGSGQFVNLFTYGSNPLACAVGDVVLRLTEEMDLAGRAARTGAYLRERLRPLEASPIVGDVRGLGLMWGVEFVADRATKEPFERGLRVAERIGEAAFARGLIIYPGTGNADGVRGDQLLIGPPLVISREEVDLLVERLLDAVDAVTAELKAEGVLPAG